MSKVPIWQGVDERNKLTTEELSPIIVPSYTSGSERYYRLVSTIIWRRSKSKVSKDSSGGVS